MCLRCLEGWLDEWISKGAKKLSHRTFLLVYFYYLVLWFWYGQEESCSHISEFCRGLNLPLEKVMASHSSTLAWKIPWTEKPGRLQSMGSLGLDTTEQLHFHSHALEKEMATHSSVLAWRIPGSGGAWWAVVCGVAQSQTRLK